MQETRPIQRGSGEKLVSGRQDEQRGVPADGGGVHRAAAEVAKGGRTLCILEISHVNQVFHIS